MRFGNAERGESGDDMHHDPARILLVEDHHLIAQGLQLALKAHGYVVDVVVADNGKQALAAAEDVRPDLVVLDLQLGETTDGTDLIQPLRDLGAVVLMLTGVIEQPRLGACLEAGAIGVASKAESFEEVLAKVRRALEGDPVNSVAERQELLTALREHRRDDKARLAVFRTLSQRERAVLGFILDGKSAETIAEESFVSLTTVRSQIRAILQKLGVNSQLAAVALARSSGWSPHTE